MASSDKKIEKRNDGVPRRNDAEKPGVQVGKFYVFRVSETGQTEPGVENDRNGRKRAHCGMTGIQGFVQNLRANPSRFKDSEGRDFEMFEVFLTKPCFGIREADSDADLVEAVIVPAGGVVLVPVNDALKLLRPYAEHPSHTIEVLLIPLEKSRRPTADGFYPRNWEIRKVSDGVVDRRTIKGLAALPALPEGREVESLPALPA